MTKLTHMYFRGFCDQDASGQFYVRKELNLPPGTVSAINAYFNSDKYYPGGEFVVTTEISSDQVSDFCAALRAAEVEYIYIATDLCIRQLLYFMHSGCRVRCPKSLEVQDSSGTRRRVSMMELQII